MNHNMFKHLKDPFSGLSHLIGAVLSLAGGLALIIPLYHRGEMVKAYSFAAFGAGLILLYSASAAYHLIITDDRRNTILRRIDHMMIYILIAATYTPVCLVALPEIWGRSLFGVTWAMALAGVILTLFVINKPRWTTVAIYLVMGWMALLAFVPLLQAVPPVGIFWIIAGGAFYSFGAIIYARKRPDPYPGVFGFHEMWHLFVMAGSLCHYLAMFTTIQYL
jgi:hemolysin III